MKEKEKEAVREFLVPYVECFVYCFNLESTDKWKKKFCKARLENFHDEHLDRFEVETGIKLNTEKNKKEFEEIYEELFMEIVNNYLKEFKKCKNDEERDTLRFRGCDY